MRHILQSISQSLAAGTNRSEALSISRQICLDALGISQNTFYLKEEITLTHEQQSLLDSILGRLSKGEPLQYILGHTSFCGLELKVTPAVLIPRQETTELVEWISEEDSTHKCVKDICTGSGCIALALAARFQDWEVEGTDISPDALEVARNNAEANDLNVTFTHQDILEEMSEEPVQTPGEQVHYDIIVSNPPYVTLEEKSSMDASVTEFEPHLALFVPDDDPLMFYRAIARYGLSHLRKEGRLYFEINPLFTTDVTNLLIETGYDNIMVKKDISGKERMIRSVLHE